MFPQIFAEKDTDFHGLLNTESWINNLTIASFLGAKSEDCMGSRSEEPIY
jgi:hypothetical protein